MDKAALETSLNNLDLWLSVFGILVAVGSVGASYAGFLHWKRSNQLQALQTQENLRLQGDVATARKSASEATARAADLGVSLETLGTFVEEQQSKASKSVEELQASQAALDAAIKAADERLAPRVLTSSQVNQLKAVASQFKGTLYSGMFSPGAVDAEALWKQIDGALQSAGWKRALIPKELAYGDPPMTMQYGASANLRVISPFAVEGDPSSGPSAAIDGAAYAMTNALNAVGVKSGYFRNTAKPNIGPEGIVFNIGIKAY